MLVLQNEFSTAMRLLGAASVSQLGKQHVSTQQNNYIVLPV